VPGPSNRALCACSTEMDSLVTLIPIHCEVQTPSVNGEMESTTSLAENPDHEARTEPPPSTDGEIDPTTQLTGTLDHEAQTELSPSELVVGFQPTQTPGLSRRHFASGSLALMHTAQFRHQRSYPHSCSGRVRLWRGFRFQGRTGELKTRYRTRLPAGGVPDGAPPSSELKVGRQNTRDQDRTLRSRHNPFRR